MTAMTIIITVVVFWTLFVVGVLVGISVHREATRRRSARLHRAEMALDHDVLIAGRTPARGRDFRV
ncbi:hypothetical protein EV188_103117 [Actinomycetospora succinea]|uniref:Uncharacterized protein n=1 Tax=Actinomycetospora succinea TaxID=663603 RepID=A0A4R6VD07_9PSEU|nr:hypothetical protein [Actinomycetospora succinea]TDQ60622.1 hypothetical protein EV188_103117 [Actinomycetospora succinea]